MKAVTICCLLIISCAITTIAQSIGTDFFAGSTPCDAWIKSELKINDSSPCEFQKWELLFDKDQFTLSVRYGMSKPNTNGFQNNGTSMEIKGSFVIVNPSGNRKTIYRLSSASFKSPLMLLKLDNNLFHILDDKQSLLVGNGGFSYSLNRIK